MGLFNDNVSPERLNWQYDYTGAELLNPAQKLLAFHIDGEAASRKTASDLLRDPAVSHNDPKIVDARKLIERHGQLREQLEVWVHEFARHPNKNFSLGLGDVTFFELQK